ncbi:cyclic GMP-AMP synthase [Hemicordylus capensis]|uniref:cyclic GMP-AMP synthase n=1 Tax=Hemicordylus capensis TaxID=884348 RepID=UPI002304121A|nr:cyclic GMP-AMP synthase [Hemicordylus capensis]
MERSSTGRGKGAKKDSTVQDAGAAAKSPSAPKGRGRRQSATQTSVPPPSLGTHPTKSKASPLDEGKGAGQAREDVASGRKKTSQSRKEVAAQAGESEQPGQRMARKEKKTAPQKVQECASEGGGEEPGHQGKAGAACRKSPASLKPKRIPTEDDSYQAGKEVIAGTKRKVSQKKKEGVPRGEESDRVEEKTQPAAEKTRAPQVEQQGCVLRAGASAQEMADGAFRKQAPSLKKTVQEKPDQKGKRSLKKVLETLTLSQKAVSEASRRVNMVREKLIEAIKKEPCFSSIEKLGSGSYYEHLKISNPDEFDIMLILPKLRLELERCDADASAGAYYFAKLKRNPGRGNLDKFLNDKGQLSASQMLSALRNIIVEEVQKIKEEKVSMVKKKAGCPAVTLLIGEAPSDISVDIILALETDRKLCDSTKDGLDVKSWLGAKERKKLLSEPLYLVPKNVKDGRCLIEDTWRLSFSLVEKIIIKHHGNKKTCCESGGGKCCRKECLKLLKYLLEQLKTKHDNRNQFDKFCSYHVKTAFFHVCSKWSSDDNWLYTDLEACFNRLLDYFLNCLRNSELLHFFIPEFNLFYTRRIEATKCKALARVIEKERENGFPIFFLEV